MNTKTKLGIVTALVVAFGLFNGLGQTSKPQTSGGFVGDALEAGVKIGYRCALSGGTTNDLAFIIKAMRDNRPDMVEGWFKGR